MDGSIEKVSIVVSKGSLEGIYPALIMATAPGLRASRPTCSSLFGLDAVSRKRHERGRSCRQPGLSLEPATPGSRAGQP
jgi:hypothetical protein